jgi:hypothetical protein
VVIAERRRMVKDPTSRVAQLEAKVNTTATKHTCCIMLCWHAYMTATAMLHV